jgi:hypothetical protein
LPSHGKFIGFAALTTGAAHDTHAKRNGVGRIPENGFGFHDVGKTKRYELKV